VLRAGESAVQNVTWATVQVRAAMDLVLERAS
jgi:hypothetical protein